MIQQSGPISATQSATAAALMSEPEKVKLLLVDDDHSNLLALQAILEPLNEDLILASSGMDALRLCLEHDFAAILLDVRMPEMDGFETAEMIRQRKRSRQTPILFLTAYRSDEQLFRGYDLGAVDFLFKPIVPEVLQSKVAVFVGLSRTDQLLRRQADALAITEKKFRAVLEAAPDAMVITTADGAIALVNSRTDSLFGYSRDRLIGSNIRDLIPEWQAPDPGMLEDTFAHASPHGTRVAATRHDGSTFPAEITLSPFQSGEGMLVTTAIRDDTVQVEAEERVRRINAELEKRVGERTLMLTRSNDALRQFAWAASHDLQEPIRMVVSFSQLVARSAGVKLSETESQMLRFVEENGMRMQTLLAALRQYIFISESGEQTWTQVDCNKVVKAAIDNLNGSIAAAAATIDCGLLPTIRSLEVPLGQVFQNLISNAIKYRRPEAPLVKISVERRTGTWLFSVSDNGIGIQEEHLDYIFGMFKRLDRDESSGTGIGLAICKAAVERLYGRIWAESQFGSGSTFFFELPDGEVG